MIIAVSVEELNRWGCPNCGYRSGSTPIQQGGCASWRCGDCSHACIVLAEGITKSTIGCYVEDKYVYPTLVDHPRRGTPAHGRPDKQPEGGGEFFRPRGIGLDHREGVGCWVCGLVSERYMRNIAAYAQCKDASDRIVRLFGRGAWTDFREREPDYVQVKIVVCDQHEKALSKLLELTRDDGIITHEKILQALAVETT